MIDFSNALEEFNKYNGSEKKKTLVYNNKKYLVKFPDPIRQKNKNISYINNSFSEYIGSNIFKLVGIDAQNTVLGVYKYNGRDKIVCACEDFTTSELELYEFENLALSSNPDKKIDTNIDDIMEVIDSSNGIIDVLDVKEKFWNMFIIDFLIGNTDRHNGNWGFLINNKTKEIKFSPVYDCGSCLNPILDDDEIRNINDVEMKNLAFNCYSCLKENDKKINYVEYLSGMKNEECNAAIRRIFDNIKLDSILNFINGIECLSSERRAFYIKLISIRYDIIRSIYNKVKKST